MDIPEIPEGLQFYFPVMAEKPDWVCDSDKKDPFGTPKEKW
jgi:hypothetical protein